MTTLGRGLNVAQTAQNLLDHVVAYFAAAPPGTVLPLPERQAIVPGDPRTVAWDCEQLTISMEGIGFGPAEDTDLAPSPRMGSPLSAIALRHVVLAVSLVRCTPSINGRGQVPIADLNAAGLNFLRDCGLLSQSMVSFASQLKAALPSTASVKCGVVTPFGPEGGYHGADTAMAITVPELI